MTNKTKEQKVLKTKWQLRRYDILNGEVNDRISIGMVDIDISGKKYNQGTEQEYTSFEVTDEQIIKAFSDVGYSLPTDDTMTTDGTMSLIYIDIDGLASFEMECTSHEESAFNILC